MLFYCNCEQTSSNDYLDLYVIDCCECSDKYECNSYVIHSGFLHWLTEFNIMPFICNVDYETFVDVLMDFFSQGYTPEEAYLELLEILFYNE